jgi:hypothetical protein
VALIGGAGAPEQPGRVRLLCCWRLLFFPSLGQVSFCITTSEMNGSPRHYTLVTLGLGLGLVGVLALLNYVVDPYNRFGLNRLGVYISAERESKSTAVRRYRHDALLVGNSRMVVIPPEQLHGFRFFNGAFAGASSEELYYFVAHFAREQKLVILSVDPWMGDPPEFQGDIFSPASCEAVLGNILNLQTLEYSFRTIFNHLSGIPNPMHADGWVDMDGWRKAADRDRPAQRDTQIEFLKGAYLTASQKSKIEMTFFKKISQCLRERNILCVVWVPPLHEEVAKFLRQSPEVAASRRRWMADLDAIFPRFVDLSDSVYCAATNFYRSDPIHFRSEIGVHMLNNEVVPVAQRKLEEWINGTASVRVPREGSRQDSSTVR